jgi:hypothetical protein
VITATGDWVRMRDYIAGRLSDDESLAFEDRLLTDPDLARELEQSLRLREGLHRLREQGHLRRAPSRPIGSRFWLPALVAAAAAGVVLFLGLYRGAWMHRATAPPAVLMESLESRSAGMGQLIAAHFTFVPVRGSSTPDLDLPSAGLIEFRLAPASRTAGPRYRVTLLRRNRANAMEPLGTLAGATLSADGYVHAQADAARLEPGSYALRIEPDAAVPGLTATFPFNLRNRGAVASP